MNKNRTAFFVVLLAAVMGLPFLSLAQKSYIYIELIKSIPCRILQNGKEVPQLNRNYILLNVAEQSEQIIDIEFGADLYPRQNFIIDVVPDAAYAYKLAKSGEKSFYLLDLINNGKIIEANSKVNIGIATALNKINFGKDQQPNLRRTTAKNSSRVGRIFTRNRAEKTPQVIPAQKATEKAETAGVKYGVVEVIRPATVNTSVKEQDTRQNTVTRPALPANAGKTSCITVASDEEAALFAAAVAAKKNEEVQLLMVRKKKFTGCLTVQQVIRIGEAYNSQYARYQLIKIVQGNVANPLEMPQCESLFKSESYKNKFLELIHAR
jgi:hypothetical protein